MSVRGNVHCKCRCLWSPEGGIGSPEAGFTSDCRLTAWALRTKPRFFARTLSHLSSPTNRVLPSSGNSEGWLLLSTYHNHDLTVASSRLDWLAGMSVRDCLDDVEHSVYKREVLFSGFGSKTV